MKLRNKPPLVCLSALVTLLVALSSASAQSLDKSVEGVLFYKEHTFLPDDSVQLIEYRSSKTYDKITYLETATGKSMRISNDQAAFVLCYPGRGQVGRADALTLADLALTRFPAHAPFIQRVKEAWIRMTPEEEKKQAHDSEIRNDFLAKVLGEIGEAVQYKGSSPPRAPDLLEDHRKNRVAATPTPPSVLDVGTGSATTSQATPEAAPSDSAATPDPGDKLGLPADLQQSLQEIKEDAGGAKTP